MFGAFDLEQRVYLAPGPTDLRRSIDGLSVLVKEVLELDPFSPCLFVFCNRNRDKLKVLHWSHNGFWLHYRRLEKGRFQWPDASHTGPIVMGQRELRWLLDGLSLQQKKAHPKVTARTII
ncbi:IS66 family insertion sequence element accessory protein TnpB [Alicyclobacillus sp. SO9]|uniref:IS66 family insertion sequence element accessory protein TnpB n=1 Tax=Alicyclobacillus sp. SO9 TaxID=2665646 RepID=UPI0018E8B62D|nr:IS66 family insertion sequence element accessory protein TnpB [Alicyclobacillus sp. SO9]QQE79739.1 IS66 family insertion sequence element accessory protein TnpB [Alicyclobacillus sp. SO9]